MADAVIYARYSSHNQREASIADQIRVCTDEAARRGDRILEVYSDRAKSGTSADTRPEFQRMIAEAKKAGWKTLYVYKLDRFARNRYDAAAYKAKLKKAGVQLVSVMEPIPDGPEGILMESLLEGMAEYYSANLSQNIRRGLEGNALQCRHNGVWCYGYDLGEDGYHHVNPEQSRLVQKVFKLRAEGMRVPDIIRELGPARNIRGNPFSANQISKMIRNERYRGVYIFGDHRVEGGCPRIVSDELWYKANGMNHHVGAKSDYPLTGKLLDGEGRKFTGTSGRGKSGKVYHYYKVQETGESYPTWKVEDALRDLVARFLRSDSKLRESIIQGVLDAQSEAMGEELAAIESLRGQLAQIEAELDHVVDALAKLGPVDRLVGKMGELEAERDEIAGELAEAERGAPILTRRMLEDLMEALVGASAPDEFVRAFVSEVRIADGRLSATLNIAKTPAQGRGSHGVPLVGTTLGCANILAEVGRWGFRMSRPFKG